MSLFSVPEAKQIRVIVNTDAKCEADDQFAIVHALLTPKFQVKGVIGAHFNPKRDGNRSMEQSYGEVQHLLNLLDMDQSLAYHGARYSIAEDDYEYSEGAKLIVEEALSDSELPLFVVFLGPITDLACAYLEHPEIAGKLTAIWIGGASYPNGGSEFNLGNDIAAGNLIFQSDIELWQVPQNVYGKMKVSLTTLEMRVAPLGEIGAYLFKQMIELNDRLGERVGWPAGESWSLGDSPTVGLMMDPNCGEWSMREVPVVDADKNYSFTGNRRHIRVYKTIDSHFILEDLYCKLEKFVAKQRKK